MPALSERKIELVRTLVEAAPDPVLEELSKALNSAADAKLSAVKRLVEAENRDRRLRNLVFEPVAGVCKGKVLASLWRGVKISAPDRVTAAQTALFDYRPGESSSAPFDALVNSAAEGLRSGAPEFDAAANAGVGDYLDLSPILRRALASLNDWLANPTEAAKFSARLAYKDATEVCADGGPRFFEMLLPHLDPPWMMLRVISAVMDKPTERYLAESELAGFGERIMDEVDEALKTIGRLDGDAGVPAAREAARLVELITLQSSEMEACIDLSRDYGWGKRIVHQKKKLATTVEGLLREAEKVVAQAMPTTQATIKKLRRTVPRLSIPPDPRQVARATTLMSFIRDIRFSASYGGFAVAHSRVLDSLSDSLDHYVEEVLELMRTADPEETACAEEFMMLAADLSVLLRDDKSGELIRRRAIAARQAA
jgi:hypothetical protein